MTDTEDIKTSEGAEALATLATGEDVAADGMAADPDMPMTTVPAETGAGDAAEDSEVLMDLEDDDDSEDSLTYSNGVIEKIVAMATREVPHVLGMKGNLMHLVQETFGAEDDDSEDSLTYSNGVIEKIVAMATREVPHVLGMKGNLMHLVQETFGAENLSKGVTIEVTDDVIEKIVAMATREVPHVLGMKGNLMHLVQETFGAENLSKGVTIEVTDDNRVVVNISVIIEYGCYAPAIFEVRGGQAPPRRGRRIAQLPSARSPRVRLCPIAVPDCRLMPVHAEPSTEGSLCRYCFPLAGYTVPC